MTRIKNKTKQQTDISNTFNIKLTFKKVYLSHLIGLFEAILEQVGRKIKLTSSWTLLTLVQLRTRSFFECQTDGRGGQSELRPRL